MALVGSGPGSLSNAQGFVDSHDVVVRVNNYKIAPETGSRTDAFYSFFGRSIRKTPDDLKNDGVTLCLCKCPCALAVQSDWHRDNGKMEGVDFRWIYDLRADWWFCDTYVPTLADFTRMFETLGRHIPTTGFAAIMEILAAEPASLYLTGFDFFRSGVHNLDEKWKPGRADDPIGHVPETELRWLKDHWRDHPLSADRVLARAFREAEAA